MISNQAVIIGVSITPVALHDPALLNAVGVHEPFAIRAVVEVETHHRAAAVVAGDAGRDGHGLTSMITVNGTVDRVFSPFEVARLDIQGRLSGRPVVEHC